MKLWGGEQITPQVVGFGSRELSLVIRCLPTPVSADSITYTYLTL